MPPQKGLDEIAVLGGRALGREIATLASLMGMKVHLYCRGNKCVAETEKAIADELDAKVERWTISSSEAKALQSRIIMHPLLDMPPQNAALVIDSLVLGKDEKAEMLNRIDEFFDPDVVIAENIGGATLAATLGCVNNRERFIGIRFFQPVWETHFVEVFKDGDINGAHVLFGAFLQKMNREPVYLPDIAGAVNVRAFLLLLNEAANMLDNGVGEPDEIDALLRDGMGMRIGPLALADIIGLEVVRNWCDAVSASNEKKCFAANPLLVRLIEQGLKGRESGRGFLNY